MPNAYKNAQGIRTRLLEIIDAHYPAISKNLPRIECVFQRSGITVRGQEAVIKVEKVNGIKAFLAGPMTAVDFVEADPFYVVSLYEEIWQVMSFDMQQYRLDCACAAMAVEYNEDELTTSLKIATPDVQTYSSVAHRHSIDAMADVKLLLKAAGQPSLFDSPPTEEDSDEETTEEDIQALQEGLRDGSVNANQPVADAVQHVKRGRGRPPKVSKEVMQPTI
jgi:hypothetical protein